MEKRVSSELVVAAGIAFIIFSILALAPAGRLPGNGSTGSVVGQGGGAALNKLIMDCLRLETMSAVNNYGMSQMDSIEWFIGQNIRECTSSFADLKEAGYSVEEAGPGVDAYLTGNTMIVSLKYPVTIKRGDETATVSDFQYSYTPDREKIDRFDLLVDIM